MRISGSRALSGLNTVFGCLKETKIIKKGVREEAKIIKYEAQRIPFDELVEAQSSNY